MRVLIVTKIFPNRLEPHSSPFNRQQFAALSRIAEVEILATIPWFPGAKRFARWSRAGRLGEVPARDVIGGLSVQHPRVAYLPKVGNRVSGPLYAASLAARAFLYRGRIDVVLGSWAYPDGYAAVVLGDLLDIPAVVKLHGSDVNLLSQIPATRRGLIWTLPRAARVVAVSRPLAERAVSFGVPRDRIDVVPNGVDTDIFYPSDRAEARRELGLSPDARIALYVGRIEREKGVFDLIRAFGWSGSELGHSQLVMIGEGAAQEECKELIDRLNLPIAMVGVRPHAEIARWLAAADVLTLPSWNEGTPNVVLEALAAGRRVVATRVGGIPDLIDSPELGLMVAPKDPAALALALERTLASSYDPASVRAAANVVDWATSAALLKQSLQKALEFRARRAA
jgi:glycosyltransferase involved in cell wall biosynthesis